MNVHPTLKAEMPSAKAASWETPASTHIPYARFLPNGMISTKNGDLMAVLALDGIPHETASPTDVAQAHVSVARFAANLDDNRTSLYLHTVRRRADPQGELPHRR